MTNANFVDGCELGYASARRGITVDYDPRTPFGKGVEAGIGAYRLFAKHMLRESARHTTEPSPSIQG